MLIKTFCGQAADVPVDDNSKSFSVLFILNGPACESVSETAKYVPSIKLQPIRFLISSAGIEGLLLMRSLQDLSHCRMLRQMRVM